MVFNTVPNEYNLRFSFFFFLSTLLLVVTGGAELKSFHLRMVYQRRATIIMVMLSDDVMTCTTNFRLLIATVPPQREKDSLHYL